MYDPFECISKFGFARIKILIGLKARGACGVAKSHMILFWLEC